MKKAHTLCLFGLIFLDQVSKFWAQHNGWAEFNDGVSFGWLAEWGSGILLVLLLGVIFALTVWALFKFWYGFYWPKVLFVAGAGSNLLDRVFYSGQVVDWLKVPFFDLRNNFADYYIFLAVFMLMLVIFKNQFDDQS